MLQTGDSISIEDLKQRIRLNYPPFMRKLKRTRDKSFEVMKSEHIVKTISKTQAVRENMKIRKLRLIIF
jgi:hypothetical protein